MHNEINDILSLAVHAPSGDNSQPWEFEVNGNVLRVRNLSKRDNPVLNFEQRGSLIAHGALLENVTIIAKGKGYSTKINYFPEGSDSEVTFDVTFEKKTEARADDLEQYIKDRHTNRKAYRKESVEKDKVNELEKSSDIESVKILTTTDRKSIDTIAKCCSQMEQIALETKELHQLFFGNLVWSDQEELKRGWGLHIKTLELPPPMRKLFRVLRRWGVTRIFNKVGFSKLASKANEQVYKSAGLYCAVWVSDRSRKSYIESGRVLQRMWLTATKLGLSAQPVTGILFLAQRAMDGMIEPFTTENITVAKKAFETIKSIFGFETGGISMLIRLGIGEKVTQRSVKRSPQLSTVVKY